MDTVTLKVLKAEIEAQLEKIDQVYRELDDRAGQMQPDVPGLVESTAYQLHNLYNAIENLFKIVANAFENSVTDRSRCILSCCVECPWTSRVSVRPCSQVKQLNCFMSYALFAISFDMLIAFVCVPAGSRRMWLLPGNCSHY